MKEQIIIEPKHELKDFLRFSYSNLYSSWGMRIMIFFSIIGLIINILYLFNFLDIDMFIDEKIPIVNIIFPFIALFFIPLFIFFANKSAFNKNFRLKEISKIIIDNEGVNEKGESYEVLTPWKKFKSIKEKKYHFILKQSKYQKGFIAKRHFDDQQLTDFKQLIKSININ